MLPAALGWLLLNPGAGTNQAAFWSGSDALWLAAAGPVTLIPLVCFNAAARHMSYASLGFLQYLAPTLVLLQAVLLYDEQLQGAQLLAFACIWLALVVFTLDSLRGRRRTAQRA